MRSRAAASSQTSFSAARFGTRISPSSKESENSRETPSALLHYLDGYRNIEIDAGGRIMAKLAGKVEDIAHAAVFFASDDAGWITGETLLIAGGFRR
ncbi:MAG TPA: SDR family oxidoreductase [Candidatus Solibacter sp.]|nr:SDR family oxidoreductase [Candidatus Solibacter sp.]